MRNFFIFAAVLLLGGLTLLFWHTDKPMSQTPQKTTFWEIQGIDTTKQSRDLAREKANDPTFDVLIDEQMENIAETGATHVAINTPYDQEFLPFLKRWVISARQNHLKIWFRGNWSGWEGWFDHPRITREQHIQLTERFILDNPDLFEAGDIFSACTECENGGPGDPRQTGDLDGFRKFLVDEYTVTKRAFLQIGRGVQSNFAPMNGDVARLVMDEATTRQLGGIVVIDHYVKSSVEFVSDIKNLAKTSGGKIMLGEFGAPIGDIHGFMNDDQQAQWIDEVLSALYPMSELIGVNYWGSVGGSTSLWRDDNLAKPAVATLTSFYRPQIFLGNVQNELGEPVAANVKTKLREIQTYRDGSFAIPFRNPEELDLTVVSEGFEDYHLQPLSPNQNVIIIMKKIHKNPLFKLREMLK